MNATQELLPGTEVHARGLRWEIVFSQKLGMQTLFCLRGLEGAVKGQELDFLHPFKPLHHRHRLEGQSHGRTFLKQLNA